MMPLRSYIITTTRLGLRSWLPSDEVPFIAMCKDPEVMEYFPASLSAEETRALIERLTQHHEKHGFTYFAIDELETGNFIGFCGFMVQTWESTFTPCVDMGWRLQRSAWGKGYATEAAKACIDVGASMFGFTEVFAFTPDLNMPSQKVMKKIGMTHVGNFQHPKIAADSRFRTCVAFRKVLIDGF